jgi:hypothetical protein
VTTEPLTPGTRVRHPGEPGWGLGQVQSAIGERVTVTFEHAGKRLIDATVVTLVPVDDDRRPSR